MNSAFIPVDADAIEALLAPRQLPEQRGPIRFYDVTLRCASRGCSSPTYIKLRGVPKCSIHVIREVNQILIELGVER